MTSADGCVVRLVKAFSTVYWFSKSPSSSLHALADKYNRAGPLNSTWDQVNEFMRRISRDEGIDAALATDGQQIDALLGYGQSVLL